MSSKTKTQQLYYLPEGAMSVEMAELATPEQLLAGDRLFVVYRGKYTIEALRKASLFEIQASVDELS